MKELIIILICCLSIQANAQDLTENLDDFNVLSVSSDVKLELILGNENKLEVDMVQGEVSDLKIEQKRKSLKIYTKSKKQWGPNRAKAKIKLYFKELAELYVAAGASVYTRDVIKSNSFEADVSSGASLQLEVVTGNFESSVSSGGTFTIEGSAKSIEINASSGGSFKGIEFKSSSGEVDASSGGSVTVWTTESIEAETSSGGSIKYRGNPSNKEINQHKWSGGSIIAITDY